MSASWETKLEQFQRSLVAFRNVVGIDLHYAVVHIRGPQVAFSERATPLVYASGGTLVESVTVPLSAEEHQLHLLYGEDFAPVRENLVPKFKFELQELRNIFSKIPPKILPPSKFPALANGGDEVFVRWGLALLWLGAREQRVFRSEIEYADSASSFRGNGRVSPWEKLSPAPGFDPIELVTQTGKPDNGWRYWSEEHAKAGRTFPEVLAVSLTKPIFYASMNAVDLLIQSGLEQRPKFNTKRRPGLTTRDGTTLTDSDRLVISALRKHHQRADGGPEFTQLTQTEFAVMAGVSQSSVNRLIRDHFCPLPICSGRSPKKCYEYLCREGLIIGILDQIENPLRREELTNIRNIDRIKVKGKADDEDEAENE